MALSIIDFSKAQGTADWSGLRDAVKNYYAGKQGAIESAYAPAQLEAEIAYRKAQSDPRLLEANIQEKLANAAKAKYWSPFSGAVGNIFALQQMKEGGALTPEQIQQLEEQIQLQQEHERATTNYSRKVADALYYGRMSPLQKKFADLDMIDQGKAISMTGDVYDLTPDQRVQRRLATGKDVINEITDPALRARVQFGNNMLTTFNSIDLDKAFARSGGWGKFANTIEKGVGALTGKQSEEFKNVQKEISKLKILAKQASQFMDAGAAQAIQEGIEEIANPNAWSTSPAVAREKFETFKQLMEQEHSNILRSVMSSQPYGVTFAPSEGRDGNGLTVEDILAQEQGYQPQAMQQQRTNPQIGNASGFVTIRNPKTGKRHKIPANEAQRYIDAGGIVID